eukprot:10521995-Ditylum_brightwellii.AAC.2
MLSASTIKQVLPIPISNELMHIPIKLGQEGNFFQPIIFCLLDTRAGLSIGCALFILGICKQYPQLVLCIIKTKDQYTPIQLTGIISISDPEEDKLLQSTHLPIVVELHMTYKTSDGTSTSLKMAIRNDIAVNIILGYPFIKSTKTTIDVTDNAAES